MAKQRAGASFAITQLFFTAQRYFDLVARVRALGSDLPIIPGIMPVTRISQIERFADLSGAALPVVRHRPAARGRPTTRRRVRAAGVDLATTLSEELLAGGAPGLHFITMNRSPGDPGDLRPAGAPAEPGVRNFGGLLARPPSVSFRMTTKPCGRRGSTSNAVSSPGA